MSRATYPHRSEVFQATMLSVVVLVVSGACVAQEKKGPPPGAKQQAPGYQAAATKIQQNYRRAVVRFQEDPKSKPTPVAVSWTVDLSDLKQLGSALPVDGIIRADSELRKVWKIWGLGNRAPAVDFNRYVVCGAADRGHQPKLFHKMTEDGDIQHAFVESALVKKYHSQGFLFVIPLNAAKAFNGVPLSAVSIQKVR